MELQVQEVSNKEQITVLMKARILEFNIGRFPQMNVQCVLGCMKMIQILRNGYNVQMKIVRCGVMLNV